MSYQASTTYLTDTMFSQPLFPIDSAFETSYHAPPSAGPTTTQANATTDEVDDLDSDASLNGSDDEFQLSEHKRTPSHNQSSSQAAKKARMEAEKEVKRRGSKACTVCRRLKMRCIGAEHGPPCQRCKTQGHECIFKPSMRGKKRNTKSDALAKQVKEMEATIRNLTQNMPPSSSSAQNPSNTSASPAVAQSTSTASSITTPNSRSVPLPQASSIAIMHSAAVAVDNGGLMMSHSSPAMSVAPLPPLTHTHSHPSHVSHGSHGSHSLVMDSSAPTSPRLNSLPNDDLNPLGLLADASLRNARRKDRLTTNASHFSPRGEEVSLKQGGQSDEYPNSNGAAPKAKIGVASEEFFRPSVHNVTSTSAIPFKRALVENPELPPILASGLISPTETKELFDIYFTYLARHNGCVLLPDLHSCQNLVTRSPFLFTCVCAVSSKFYSKRPDLYAKCMAATKEMVTNIFGESRKSVEIVQGLILLGCWSQPALRYEEDRMWQYFGFAIRMAQELSLGRRRSTVARFAASSPEMFESMDEETKQLHEREISNCERTWLFLFIMDRSAACQTGRPYMMREDYLIRHAKEWCSRPVSRDSDLALVACVPLACLIGQTLDLIYSDYENPNLLNKSLNYDVALKMFEERITAWYHEWTGFAVQRGGTPWERLMAEFFCCYYKLVFFAFGLQSALEKGDISSLYPMTMKCYQAAARVLTISRDGLYQEGMLRSSHDNIFVMISYCSVFLLKLISPRFHDFVKADDVLRQVSNMIDVFENIAVDDTHTPALYASFLRVLLQSKEEELKDHVKHPRAPVQMPTSHRASPREGIVSEETLFTQQAFHAMDQEGFWNNFLVYPGQTQGNLSGGNYQSHEAWSDFMSITRPGSPANGSHGDLFGTSHPPL